MVFIAIPPYKLIPLLYRIWYCNALKNEIFAITHWVKYSKYANAQQNSISTSFGFGNARLGSRIQEILTGICKLYYSK
jgi:hypothetical protein